MNDWSDKIHLAIVFINKLPANERRFVVNRLRDCAADFLEVAELERTDRYAIADALLAVADEIKS